jgi:hypothetical protein
MNLLKVFEGNIIRFTSERIAHILDDHPELKEQIVKIEETLLLPDIVRLSKTDETVRMYYRYYTKTPVTTKHLCVLVKTNKNDYFVITAYFTDSIKKGDQIWEKK